MSRCYGDERAWPQEESRAIRGRSRARDRGALLKAERVLCNELNVIPRRSFTPRRVWLYVPDRERHPRYLSTLRCTREAELYLQ